MIIRLMLCKKHGGSFRGMKYQRWAETGVRCPACEMERRALRNKMEMEGGKVPYELQVNLPADGWTTLEEHTDQMEAIRSMDELHSKFRNAELQVINVVRVVVREEDR